MNQNIATKARPHVDKNRSNVFFNWLINSKGPLQTIVFDSKEELLMASFIMHLLRDSIPYSLTRNIEERIHKRLKLSHRTYSLGQSGFNIILKRAYTPKVLFKSAFEKLKTHIQFPENAEDHLEAVILLSFYKSPLTMVDVLGGQVHRQFDNLWCSITSPDNTEHYKKAYSDLGNSSEGLPNCFIKFSNVILASQ